MMYVCSLIQYGASTVVEVIEYKELTKKSYSFVIKIPARFNIDVIVYNFVIFTIATWSRCGAV